MPDGFAANAKTRCRRSLYAAVAFVALYAASLAGAVDLTFKVRGGASVATMQRGLVGAPLSVGFLGKVGGVAFMNTATPAPGFENQDINVSYDASAADGYRFKVTIGAATGVIRAPDWVVAPAVLFANSSYTAAYTATDDTAPNGEAIHPVLKDTQMGLIVYYADHMLIDPRRRDEVTTSGANDDAPFIRPFDDLASQLAEFYLMEQRIDALEQGQESFIYLDSEVRSQFSIKAGELHVTGNPYVLFWKFHNSDRGWATIEGPTSYFKRRPSVLRDLNPAVFSTAEKFSQLVSFFRHARKHNQSNWKDLVAICERVKVTPAASN